MQRLKTPYLLIGMILLIEALLFAPRQGAFVLDDNPSVLQNSLLLKSLPQAILSSPFRAVTVGVNWANLHAFGFDPQAFRQVNLALHLVMSLLLFFLIREFAENEKDKVSINRCHISCRINCDNGRLRRPGEKCKTD